MPQAPSTRWCPTPEQLMILEEMYRNGVRTPNASQIQQITAHLSYYGKIEGKNVFYWFQNHKARDRQKLRRKLSRHPQLLHHHHHHSAPHPLHLHSLEESLLLPPHQLQQQTPLQFLHQGCCQETTQGLNLLCQLDTGAGREEVEAPAMTGGTTYGYEWMTMMGHIETTVPPCCRPLKTLDLFPTKSTGLKDECCSTSKSCSSSTSTN